MRILLRRSAPVICLTAAMMFAACAKKKHRIEVHPVSGSVAFEGGPVPGALVVFHPKNPQSERPIRPVGYVAADGSFEIGTFDKSDGAPAGKYVVTVEWLRRPKSREDVTALVPNLLPAKYARPETSKLEVEVVAGANRLDGIRLKR